MVAENYIMKKWQLESNIPCSKWRFPLMGVPNSWMVYHGKMLFKWITRGTPISETPQMALVIWVDISHQWVFRCLKTNYAYPPAN